jgi:hypothetical protein
MFVAPLFLEINLNYGVGRFSLLGFFKQDPDDNEDTIAIAIKLIAIVRIDSVSNLCYCNTYIFSI